MGGSKKTVGTSSQCMKEGDAESEPESINSFLLSSNQLIFDSSGHLIQCSSANSGMETVGDESGMAADNNNCYSDCKTVDSLQQLSASKPRKCNNCSCMLLTCDLQKCSWCERALCNNCVRICQKCQASFCSVCSVINYDDHFERTFCLQCT